MFITCPPELGRSRRPARARGRPAPAEADLRRTLANAGAARRRSGEVTEVNTYLQRWLGSCGSKADRVARAGSDVKARHAEGDFGGERRGSGRHAKAKTSGALASRLAQETEVGQTAAAAARPAEAGSARRSQCISRRAGVFAPPGRRKSAALGWRDLAARRRRRRSRARGESFKSFVFPPARETFAQQTRACA